MPPKHCFSDLSKIRDSEFFAKTREVVQDEVRQSEHFNPYCDTTQKNMEREKEMFEDYSVETFHVEKDKVWGVDDDILTRICSYLGLRLQYSVPQATRAVQGATHVKWNTLKSWMFTLIACVSLYVPENKGFQLLNEFGYTRIFRHCAFLCKTYNLARDRPPPTFFGKDEFRLLVENEFARDGNHLLKLQTMLMFSFFYSFGVRAGAIGPSIREWEGLGKFLKWKDISIMRVGRGSYEITVNFFHLKGYQTLESSKLSFTWRPVTRGADTIMDFGIYLVIYALKRGVLKVKTFEELLDDTAVKVDFRHECLEEAVIVAAKSAGTGLVDDRSHPMSPSGMQAIFKSRCEEFGLEGLSLRSMRRNFAETMADAVSDRDLGLHHATPATNRSFYASGSAGIDVSSIMTSNAPQARAIVTGSRRLPLGPSAKHAPQIESRLDGIQERKRQAGVALRKQGESQLFSAVPMPSSRKPIQRVGYDKYEPQEEDAPRLKKLKGSDEYETANRLRKQSRADFEKASGHTIQRSGSKREKLEDVAKRTGKMNEWNDYQKKLSDVDKLIAKARRQDAIDSEREKARVAAKAAPLVGAEQSDLEKRQQMAAAFEKPSRLIESTSTTAHDENEDDGDRDGVLPADHFFDQQEAVPDNGQGNEFFGSTADIRIGYAKMLDEGNGGFDAPTACLFCSIDPTTESDKGLVYKTQSELHAHQHHYHSLRLQCTRWYHMGDYKDGRTKGSCLLCLSEGIPSKNYVSHPTRHFQTGHAKNVRSTCGSFKFNKGDKDYRAPLMTASELPENYAALCTGGMSKRARSSDEEEEE